MPGNWIRKAALQQNDMSKALELNNAELVLKAALVFSSGKGTDKSTDKIRCIICFETSMGLNYCYYYFSDD